MILEKKGYCRYCSNSKNDIQTKFHENLLDIRTNESHQTDILAQIKHIQMELNQKAALIN